MLGLDKILSALPDCFIKADSLMVKTGLISAGRMLWVFKKLLGFGTAYILDHKQPIARRLQDQAND